MSRSLGAISLTSLFRRSAQFALGDVLNAAIIDVCRFRSRTALPYGDELPSATWG